MPKHRWLSLLLATLTLSACTLAQRSSTANNPEALCDAVSWVAVTDQVWMAQGDANTSNPENRGFVSNAVFVLDAGAKGSRAWLLGTGPSPAWGQALRCSLQHQLREQATDVVSMRAHPESVLGLSAFEHQRSWALPQVREAMRERCPGCTTRLAQATDDPSISLAAIRLPALEIDARATEPASRVRVAHMESLDVYAIERAPNEWTTLAHVRGVNVWVAPGLVWGSEVLPDLREASLDHMIAALEWLMRQNPQVIVPEQGRAVTAAGIARDLSYWYTLRSQVTEAVRAGQSLNELLLVATNVPSTADRSPAQGSVNTQRHSLNLQRAWHQAEEAYFKRSQNAQDADLSLR